MQELNQGLLHCRWILYQLNYQGNPDRRNLRLFKIIRTLLFYTEYVVTVIIKLENSAVVTGLEKVSFHFNPKER